MGGVGGVRGGGGPSQVDHVDDDAQARAAEQAPREAETQAPAHEPPPDDIAPQHTSDPRAAELEARLAQPQAAGRASATGRASAQDEPGFLDGVRSRVSSARARAERAVGEAGQRLEAGGRQISQAAGQARQAVSDRVHQTIDGAGRQIESAGREAQELRQGVSRGVRDIGQRTINAGQQAIQGTREGLQELGQRAQTTARETIDTARQGLERARAGAEDAIQQGRNLVDMASGAIDPGTHIDQLDGTGDSVSVSLQGSASAEGIAGQANGEMEISRIGPPEDPEGYEIEVSGGVAAGIGGNLGSAEGSAMLGAGGSATLRFTGPNARRDAERAAEISMQMAAVGGAAGVGAGVGSGLGPVGQVGGAVVAGGAAHLLVGPSQDDLRFMANNVHQIEVRGGVAAELAAEAGGPGFGGDLGGNAAVEMGATLTFPHTNGSGERQPASMSIFAEGRVGGEVEGGVASGVVGADFEGTVRREIEVNLPASATGANLRRDPVGTALSSLRNAELGDDTLTIAGQVRGHVGTSHGLDRGSVELSAAARAHAGTRVELQFAGNAAELQRARERAMAGDLNGAVGSVNQARVSGTVETFRDNEVELTGEAAEGGVGVGLEAQYQHHDVRSSNTIGVGGSPRQARDEVARLLARARAAGVN